MPPSRRVFGGSGMTGEWIDTTIGEQATLQRGIDITKAEQRAGAVPVISSGGVSSCHDTPAVSGPGVVLGRKGVVGSVYFVVSDYWPHDTTLWVKDFHGNDRRFVYYFFRWMAPRLATMDVGSANPTLNRNHVHPIRICWPPLAEQQAIAHILGTLDDKIDLNRRTNETLEAIARALFKSWFVDFDPVRAKAEGRDTGLPPHIAELFPDSFEDSELGEIPSGWRVGPILQRAMLLSGGTPKTERTEFWDGGILWASAKDVSQCGQTFLVSTERTITEKGLDGSATQLIPAFSTVVVARGATTGRMALLGQEMAMNQTCYALVSRTESPFALYCQFHYQIADLVHAAHGSVFDTITTSTFKNTPFLLPSPRLFAQFEEIVTPLFRRILTSSEQSRSLAALRDALLPKLLSGEVRVKDAERMVQPIR